jgi:hypothetical protein
MSPLQQNTDLKNLVDTALVHASLEWIQTLKRGGAWSVPIEIRSE